MKKFTNLTHCAHSYWEGFRGIIIIFWQETKGWWINLKLGFFAYSLLLFFLIFHTNIQQYVKIILNKIENTFNPIPPRRGSWRLPAHSNHWLSNMDRVTWLKTLWQYNFKSPAHLRRMSFIVHYQKFKEFWIWKYVAEIFLIFQAFFHQFVV